MLQLFDVLQVFGLVDGLVVWQFVVFFDFDGMLFDIVEDFDVVWFVFGVLEVLQKLVVCCLIVVFSGCDLVDVIQWVGLFGIWYVGSYGFELIVFDGMYYQNDVVVVVILVLKQVVVELCQ